LSGAALRRCVGEIFALSDRLFFLEILRLLSLEVTTPAKNALAPHNFANSMLPSFWPSGAGHPKLEDSPSRALRAKQRRHYVVLRGIPVTLARGRGAPEPYNFSAPRSRPRAKHSREKPLFSRESRPRCLGDAVGKTAHGLNRGKHCRVDGSSPGNMSWLCSLLPPLYWRFHIEYPTLDAVPTRTARRWR